MYRSDLSYFMQVCYYIIQVKRENQATMYVYVCNTF